MRKILFEFLSGRTADFMCQVMTAKMFLRSNSKRQAKSEEDNPDFPFLDLPELVLESILRQLSPYCLCQLAQTCTDLQRRCRSDEIWEPLFNERWGKIIGPIALSSWHRIMKENHQKNAKILAQNYSKTTSMWMRPLKCIWYFSRHSSKLQTAVDVVVKPDESFATLYWYLECGEFWFPAQVYNRENNNAGFMLSCYDAELSYDCNSDTFCARYWPFSSASRIIENGISWERIRKPPVETSPNELYIAHIVEELRPGDHIEVQWKRSHIFPYGWWYGIVGHAENCKIENQHCRCHLDEMLWLEFRQYSRGSRWRRIQIKRNRGWENGNESDGIYGGVRKLHNKEDIATWLKMRPKESLK